MSRARIQSFGLGVLIATHGTHLTPMVLGMILEAMDDRQKGAIGCGLVSGLAMLLSAIHPMVAFVGIPLIFWFGIRALNAGKAAEASDWKERDGVRYRWVKDQKAVEDADE